MRQLVISDLSFWEISSRLQHKIMGQGSRVSFSTQSDVKVGAAFGSSITPTQVEGAVAGGAVAGVAAGVSVDNRAIATTKTDLDLGLSV